MSFTVRNHYVPQWYQWRFFPAGSGQSKLWYLDLHPDPIVRPDGIRTTRRAMRQLGPINCFRQDHLYTLYFGEYATDVIEKHFFGAIDSMGEKAVPFFADYSVREGVHEAFRGMQEYLSAQMFRTPKGLDMLRTLAKTPDRQRTLAVLLEVWQVFNTIWCESVWEVVHCKSSPTKFIISDAPVATYNKRIFPGSPGMRHFGNAPIECVGTHTIFPIDLEHCLIITNLQYVRNPKANPLKIRENPRYFSSAHFDLRKIQRGREIEEQEVIAINHVLKTNARRYIAAADKSWMFPEVALKERFWSKLGGKHFLHPDPRKVSFTTAIISGGYPDGSAWGYNEYGHFDLDGPRAQKLRQVEWKTFEGAKHAWDERDRRAGRQSPEDLSDYW